MAFIDFGRFVKLIEIFEFMYAAREQVDCKVWTDEQKWSRKISCIKKNILLNWAEFLWF